ncbi:MAG: response regulator [Spirochaetaceae bacterium]
MSKRVLVIDDDDYVRDLYKVALEEQDFQVETAENGKVGVKKYQSFTPDAVVLDVLMPDQEGVETIRELRNLDSTVKVIAVSGGGKIHAKNYLDMMRHFGAVETFEKPVSMKRLIDSIEEHS